ncbi:MAG: anthranilate synthase component I [Thaumarchaeota archaeon 13_1_40CM_38_12]|nr:MAG: anthranilate synthase component I [Thaumarchaeota archaeon 13_1_40CM_38_12]OLC36331.1 MAG: anthranilate synthase component I [Thaumarchaeota archaeon 13_1_40CM_4_38_7]OLC92965.1 MAG: anthranilate synthase component I [Thaumarchaeota archaeon 13_1_40CM_3_38_6]OLD41636.1 MAG: anthranilate synthase component I [Thaumarchaeota archaeon 13_1_40CM_2_39_4]
MATFGHSNLKVVPLEYTGSQFDLYNKISRDFEYTFLFESLTGPEELAETSIIGFDPSIIVKGFADKIVLHYKNGSTITIQTTDPLSEIKKLLYQVPDQKYRYVGGAVGVINYDAIRLWEKIPNSHKKNESPLMEFGIYTDGILYDNIERKSFYFYYDKNRVEKLSYTDVAFGTFTLSNISENLDRNRFDDMVMRAKKYIHDGDIFQVVLSRKFNFTAEGDFLKVYKILRQINPSPYLYHMKLGSKIIIGSSPEMLLRITGSTVETFPIAGTRPITHDEERNEILREEMLHDEKELAEHTMLVDLGRNDIGRVCKYGSVHVKELMAVKRFSHVQHMVTHVVGTLDKKYNMFDAMKAVFPAGTVSGAPKIRAMDIIDEQEPDARGPYAGAIGYFSFNGCCDFAIAIRTIFVDGKEGFVQTGAGIVSDSIAENEWMETQHKANAMISALKEAAK